MEYIFKQAKPVWGTDLKTRYNSFWDFMRNSKSTERSGSPLRQEVAIVYL